MIKTIVVIAALVPLVIVSAAIGYALYIDYKEWKKI